MRQVLFFLIALLSASPLLAHDLWLEAAGNDYLLLQGHRHAGHAGAKTLAYDAAQVGGALCVEADGRRRELKVPAQSPVRLAGPCAVLQVSFTSGYWTKTAWGTTNQPKTGLSGALRSWQAQEAVKRIGQWTPASAKPLGVGLEITPLRDPFAVKVGDKLNLLVTDAGQPLAGIPVAYGDAMRGVSGADGQIAIRLRHGGLQLISASRETPLNDGKADILLRSTSLQFEISR